MPLVQIHSFPPSDPKTIPRLVTQVRDAGAAAFACAPDNIWVQFIPLAPGHYVQGSGAAAETVHADSHPPVVVIRAQRGRSREQLTALATAISETLAEGLGIPGENVWIHYQEMESADVFFKNHWSA